MNARAVLACVALVAAACDSGTVDRAEVSSTRVVMREAEPIPPGTAPRGTSAYLAAARTPPADPAAAAREGRARYAIFCTPCHGSSGAGDGPVVSRGFPPPPSFHDEAQRGLTLEHVAAVIAQGKGRMYPMAERVAPAERWAIAAYVKELQARGPAGGAAR